MPINKYRVISKMYRNVKQKRDKRSGYNGKYKQSERIYQ